MKRVSEFVSGTTAVIGKKKVLNNIFFHIIQECRDYEGKTFVLCGNNSHLLGAKENEAVRMGVYAHNKERLPEMVEPFLNSPTIGTKLESIVSALTDVFYSGTSAVTTNEQFFLGNSEILFSELMKYSLLMMKLRGNFSTSEFASCYTTISNEFPKMVQIKRVEYPNAELNTIAQMRGESPFSDTLISLPPATAQSVEGTMRTATAKLKELLNLISLVTDEGDEINSFSFTSFITGDTENSGGDIAFLEPANSMKGYSKLLFRLLCEGLKYLARDYPDTELRIVIPDISYWREPAVLLSLLEERPENLSIIWGASNINLIEQNGKAHRKLGLSLVSMSESHVWARNGDAVANDIYEVLVPQPTRSYRLSQIPEQLCFIKSEEKEFEPVRIPEAPELENFYEPDAKRTAPSLWKDKIEVAVKIKNKWSEDDDDSEEDGENNDDENGVQ